MVKDNNKDITKYSLKERYEIVVRYFRFITFSNQIHKIRTENLLSNNKELQKIITVIQNAINIKSLTNFKSFKEIADAICKHLGSDHKLIFEYVLVKKRNDLWWKKYFSKSTYYRKLSSLLNFLIMLLL